MKIKRRAVMKNRPALCVCEGMKDYRTFKEDFLKLVEFAEWYKDYIA